MGRKQAARRVARLAELADRLRAAFAGLSPAEQREGYDMLRRVAEKANQRRIDRERHP